ncbi:hypothetical protein BOX15_Mlig018958g3 [Macrostomum lignano]|uniref:Uncharacterized protein n=2 Tax=Macrostomum lignano TaxID=282301 RepID=A0A267GI59_9PLAT|nr:hypothetical protein BOX15_Mlig018958g3 [Macrostomum lignano]
MDSAEETSPLLSNQSPALNAPTGDHNNEVEYQGCAACNPRSALHRYLALSFMCFLSFGSYFCYDNPSALQDVMTEDLSLTTAQYSSFYAWYSWPNVVLSMIGGYLIDRLFGIRLGAIIFSSFCLVGQLLFAFGAFINKVWLMDAARFLFGIGGESLAVAQNTYATSWFRGHELNMVFGIQLSMSRIGSTVNMNVMQPIYHSLDGRFSQPWQQLGAALFLAAFSCILSLGCAFVLAYIDRRAKRLLGADAGSTGEKIQLSDIIRFPAAVWLLCGICVAYYVSVFPFISLGQVFFERKFNFNPNEADAVNSLPYIVSAISSPVCGFLIDRTGRNIMWVMLGSLMTMGCHACLAFTFNLSPYGIMIWLGVSYSILAASLWPLVSYCLPNHMLGTAYGIMQSIQNLGLAVINQVSGLIVDSKGYLILEVFFLAWLCLALIFCAVLYLWDISKLGGELNKSASSRRKDAELAKQATEAAAKAADEA